MKPLTDEDRGKIIGLACTRRGIDILNEENLSRADRQEMALMNLILEVVSAYFEVQHHQEQ